MPKRRRPAMPGAGRPPLAGVRAVQKSIRLTPDEWARIEAIDPTSYSAAVRILLANQFADDGKLIKHDP